MTWINKVTKHIQEQRTFDNINDAIRITSSNNVPNGYDSLTDNSEQYNIVKGNLNKLRLRPQIQNEHCESSREAMGIVDINTVAGQVFKASQNNINGIALTLQSAETFSSFDGIASGAGENKIGTIEYTSDAALQAEYIASGTLATRGTFTDITGTTQSGSFALKAPMDTLADKWTASITSTDLTGFSFSFKFSQTKDFNKAKCYFFIGDGVNTKSFPISISQKNIWQNFNIQEASMNVTANDLTAVTPNMTAITNIGFRIDDSDGGEFIYVDNITYQTNPGSVDVELWDHGATLPLSNGTVDYTTSTQYTELGDRGISGIILSTINIPLIGGKRKYHVDNFIAGTAEEHPDNTLLTPNNYYSIVLKYVDTDVTVYGPNTLFNTKYYTNGYAWKAEVVDNFIDKIQGINGAGAYSDLMFQIFSSQDVYYTDVYLLSDNPPGTSAGVSIFLEDKNMKVSSITSTEQKGGMGRTMLEFDSKIRPAYLAKGGKIEAYYNDDASDDVSLILFGTKYLYISPTING